MYYINLNECVLFCFGKKNAYSQTRSLILDEWNNSFSIKSFCFIYFWFSKFNIIYYFMDDRFNFFLL